MADLCERLAIALAHRNGQGSALRHWRQLSPQRRRWWQGWALGILSSVNRAGLKVVPK